jgi:hypothetical protein
MGSDWVVIPEGDDGGRGVGARVALENGWSRVIKILYILL